MDINNTCTIDSASADHTGRILNMLLEAKNAEEREKIWKDFCESPFDRCALQLAADSLLALGNDTEALLTY